MATPYYKRFDPPRSRAARFAIGLAAVAAAGLVRVLLRQHLGTEMPYLTFGPAVFVAAVLGGLWPGVLAAFLSAACVDYYFLSPVGSWPIHRTSDIMGLIVFLSTGWGLSVLAEVQQRDHLRAREAHEQLQREAYKRRDAESKSALLSNVVTHSSDAIISKTLEGVVTSWNLGAQHLLGYTPDEAIGRHISLIIPPDLADEETHILGLLNRGEPVEPFETRRIHKDGHVIYASITISPVRDADGTITGASKILRDITGHKQAEHRFQSVVEATPNAMVMIDYAGKIRLVNNRTEQWFGYHRDELIGQPVEILLPERFRDPHPGHRAGFFEKSARVGPGERAMGPDRDLHARRKDGSEFPIEVGLNPMQTEDGPMVLSAIVDVTARKQLDEDIREFNRILERQVSERTAQLLAANKELEEFAYAASHDLKAPLRVIDNCSKWIEEDLAEHLSGDSRENMKLLRGRVKRMEKLLDDLLAYARVGHGRGALEPAIMADALVRDVVELLAPQGFAVNVSPEFASIQVRVMPLQQILMNLIGNAIKHHHRKEGVIDVTVEDRGGEYLFAVKDDGPGIPARFHDQVFKMFQTLRPRDEVEGSGMGLAIVRKNVELAGGTIEIESGAGEGSTFRFTLPKVDKVEQEALEPRSRVVEHAIREALALSEERLRLALDSAQIGIWEQNPVTGEVLWDARSKAIFGFADFNVEMSEAMSCIHPGDYELVLANAKAYQDPAGDGRFEMEFRIHAHDTGALRYVYDQGQTYFEGHGANRRAVRSIGTLQDITPLKEKELALEAANKELEEFAEGRGLRT